MKEKPFFRIAHIGVNLLDEDEAKSCAQIFNELFNLEINKKKENKDSCFTGTEIEWMKHKGLGKHGHIALETDDIERAREYLESKGFMFRDDTIKYLPDGRINVIYSDQEIGGFAIHLMQKQ